MALMDSGPADSILHINMSCGAKAAAWDAAYAKCVPNLEALFRETSDRQSHHPGGLVAT